MDASSERDATDGLLQVLQLPRVLLSSTRLGVAAAISPGHRRPLGRAKAGDGRRGTRPPETVNSARPTATHSKGVGIVVIVQVCETQIQTAAGRHLQLCTNLPPSRLWVLHPSHGGWDAMQDVSTSELHREIDAWPAAAGPVASDWLPKARAGRQEEATDNTPKRESQGREEKPTTSLPQQQSSSPLLGRPTGQHQRASQAHAENRRERSDEKGTDSKQTAQTGANHVTNADPAARKGDQSRRVGARPWFVSVARAGLFDTRAEPDARWCRIDPRTVVVRVDVIWPPSMGPRGGPDCLAFPSVQQSRPTRTSSPQAFEGLRPLAYPCIPSTPTTGSDGGWWTAQWAQDLQGLGFQEGANVPMYRSTPRSHQPPCRPEPKGTQPHVTQVSRYPCTAPPPSFPWPLSALMYPPCKVCTEPRWTGRALLGTARSSSTRSRPTRWPPGLYRNLTPPKQVRSSHTFGPISPHHQPPPTTTANKPHTPTRDRLDLQDSSKQTSAPPATHLAQQPTRPKATKSDPSAYACAKVSCGQVGVLPGGCD